MASNTTTANWYTQQYGGSFRTSRLRASSLLGPNSRFQPSVQPTQQTLVVDVQRPNGGNSQQKEESKNVRRRETIFGPDVGEDDEPGWTKADEGTKVDVNVVKGWVEKAKSEEGLHATTTLQALVNLKRPTLLLQQLELEVSRSSLEGQDIAENEIIPATGSRPASTMPGPPVHSLKFNYDAITPLVNITLSIHPTPPAPLPVVEGKEVPSIAEEEPKTVYSGIHSGGFNQLFTLPYEHALDLSSAVAPMTNVNASESAVELDGEDKVVRSEDSTRPWNENALHTLNINSSNAPDLATVPEGRANDNESVDVPAHPRAGVASRVFGRFSRRNREADLESAAQIELQNREQAKEEASKETEEKEPEKGMRLLIRIEAVGPEGQILKRRNAQLTHILISGMWVPEAGSPVGPGQAGKRVWIVKVVRREAVIGAHTFLLKEIYGLSSSTQNTQPTSYPPGEADPYASTPNECIVCLTSPRDVVLLPCRHLVVCRDCAVGMIEFGAGGKVARRDEGDTGTGETPAGSADAAAAAAGAPAPPVAGGTTATGRERRKKKAKGWYCPVCRQPYTSLLRLALPSSEKPEPDDHVHPSRPASIRSVRTTHSRRAPSIAPSLPGGAERMLESLRPHGHDQSDDEDDDLNNERVVERPQFVLGPELDEDDKGTVEHREQAQASGSDVQTAAPKRQSLEGKGWKEAV